MLLLVDDDHHVRNIVGRMLEDAGFRVLEAESGARALEVFEQASIRLVITDLKMPGMDGEELAERLRRLKPMVPILFISGFTSPRTTTRLPGPLLVKPFTEPILVDRVRQLLRDFGLETS